MRSFAFFLTNYDFVSLRFMSIAPLKVWWYF